MIRRTRQSVGYRGKSLLTTSHTSRTLNPIEYSQGKMSDLVMRNLRDFRTLVKFNSYNGLHLYKMNGDIVPIATHPFNVYDWYKDYHQIFESIGKWMENERFRIILDPPVEKLQFGQESEKDILGDLDCLRYYCKLLDTMNLSSYNKVLLNVGHYPDTKLGHDRFIKSYFRMPPYIKKRIALYNDRTQNDIEEILYVASEIKVPVVFNHYEGLDKLSKSFLEYKRRVLKSWQMEDGNPIIQVFEKDHDTKKEFYELIKYDEISPISELLNKENISLIYESSFKDIAATKISNVVTEHKGVFLKEACIKEWQRYRHLAMAHDPDGFVEMQEFMDKLRHLKNFIIE